jgi:hypothetical protein
LFLEEDVIATVPDSKFCFALWYIAQIKFKTGDSGDFTGFFW